MPKKSNGPECLRPRRLVFFTTVKAIFTLRPDTQKSFIIAGSAPPDRRFLDFVQAELKTWIRNLDLEFTLPLPRDGILE